MEKKLEAVHDIMEASDNVVFLVQRKGTWQSYTFDTMPALELISALECAKMAIFLNNLVDKESK